MKKIFQLYLANALLMFVLAGCKNGNVEYKYPKTARDLREERVGSLVNENPEGGIVLFGSGSKANNKAAINKTVNNYLWYATLDVLDFMPIQSSDSAGGVLVTDWYENFQMPGERFKINVVILGSELKAEAIKVKVFKQRLNKNFTWRDVEVSPNVARELEDKILIRARQLRISKEIK